MSNLGAYQLVTTYMKRMGGPTKAIPLTVGGIAFASIGLWELAKKGIAFAQDHINPVSKDESPVILVVNKGQYEDLILEPGDKFKVLERDKESVLITIEGREDNPFVVPEDFLTYVTAAYKGESEYVL